MGDKTKKTSGYHQGTVDTVLSVDAVAKEAASMAEKRPTRDDLWRLAGNEPFLTVEKLVAGYGAMEILHGIDLAIGKGAVALSDRAEWVRVNRPFYTLFTGSRISARVRFRLAAMM